MLDGVREGLDRADKLPVGVTQFDVQAYLRHAAGISRAGVHGDISSRLTDSISAFAEGGVGLLRMRGSTSLEARLGAGIRGTF
jgi:hypothetical protein